MAADALVLLDDVQYVTGGAHDHYANRCALPSGWATVPVRNKFGQTIREARPVEGWQPDKLISRIAQEYRLRADHWLLRYLRDEVDYYDGTLTSINVAWIRAVRRALGLAFPIHLQSHLGVSTTDRDRRLYECVRRVGGDAYLAGPGGPGYMRPDFWRGAMPVYVSRYAWPVYPRAGEWLPHLSIVDALVHVGYRAWEYLQTEKERWRIGDE